MSGRYYICAHALLWGEGTHEGVNESLSGSQKFIITIILYLHYNIIVLISYLLYSDEVSVGLIVPLVIVSILLVIVITILILVLILYFNKKKVPTSDSVALSQVKENEYDDSGKEIA